MRRLRCPMAIWMGAAWDAGPLHVGLQLRESIRRFMANQRMTQTQLVRSLAEGCEVNNTMARDFLDSLASLAIGEVKKNGLFVLPGIGRLVRVARKARTARTPAPAHS